MCLEGERRVIALEPGTGAVPWTGEPPDGWRAVTRDAAAPSMPIKPDTYDGRPLVAVAGGADPRLVGTLPAGVLDCRVGTGSLVCRTSADRLGVWRLR